MNSYPPAKGSRVNVKRSRNSMPNTEPITTYIRNVKLFAQLFNELFICAAPSFHSVFTVGQPSCPFLSFRCCWVCLPSQPRYRHVRHVFIRLLTHTVLGLASTIWSNVDLYTYTGTSVSSPMAHIAIARLGLEHTAIRHPIYVMSQTWLSMYTLTVHMHCTEIDDGTYISHDGFHRNTPCWGRK